jgi:hypothetical protein
VVLLVLGQQSYKIWNIFENSASTLFTQSYYLVIYITYNSIRNETPTISL